MINISIIGCGFISYYYLVSMKNYNNIKLIGVYDKIESRKKDLSEYFQCKSYESFNELLNDNVELVINLTNPKDHYEINKQILLSKKHLYCEKPITLSINQLNDLIKITKRNNIFILSAPANYLSNYCIALKKCFQENIIGKVYKIDCKIIETTLLNNDKFLNKLGICWPYIDEINTGCNLEHCGYILTLITTLFGSIQGIISNEYINSSIQIGDKIYNPDVPNYYISNLKLKNNIDCRIINTTNHDILDRSITFYGEKGKIVLKDIWNYNSLIYKIIDNKKAEIKYDNDIFQQDWNLYMDIMRPISYFEKDKKSVMNIEQIKHILDVMLKIQRNECGSITI